MSDISRTEMESSALATLQCAVEKYSKEKNISYEDALGELSGSNTYKALFDFDTLLWTQGPDYFISVYESEIAE